MTWYNELDDIPILNLRYVQLKDKIGLTCLPT